PLPSRSCNCPCRTIRSCSRPPKHRQLLRGYSSEGRQPSFCQNSRQGKDPLSFDTTEGRHRTNCPSFCSDVKNQRLPGPESACPPSRLAAQLRESPPCSTVRNTGRRRNLDPDRRKPSSSARAMLQVRTLPAS